MLVRSLEMRYLRLISLLIDYGASIEFQDACAVKTALKNADLDILHVLLHNDRCSATLLSNRIPHDMVVKPRTLRLRAMKALADRVLPIHLGPPLQSLLAEGGELDSGLIQLLLRNGAPIDGVGDKKKNAVLATAKRGNMEFLKMLCDTGPSHVTLSRAVPAAFSSITTSGHDVALGMIKLPLEREATGSSLDETLLKAVRQDQVQLVELLLEHGANANTANGLPFLLAIESSNRRLFQV